MSQYKTFTKIQNAFIRLVDARADEQGFGKREFACKVWPELSMNSANARWTAMRNKARNTGKPQGLLLVDAFRMAEALGENPTYLIGKAAEEAAIDARLVQPIALDSSCMTLGNEGDPEGNA